MFEFIDEHLGFFIIATIVSVIVLSAMAYKDDDKELRECFFQKPRTAECEYRLWKYGARRNTSTNTTTVVPVRR